MLCHSEVVLYVLMADFGYPVFFRRIDSFFRRIDSSFIYTDSFIYARDVARRGAEEAVAPPPLCMICHDGISF